ncbi:unnamed protein product (macronuclear) [Paramecium tetraurelia]|uniref:rRNA-processing protein EFG1 n=1 Tax=Paramecium tetraurelia TaxID=5888 RepID=A0E3V6_PARTE|nr:uncharacterized protein GSPATT00023146001 [Paramecium tetraurelia]CAK89973.1 unnamed protein product [Paramecium tetraurelia]|eukprot:XP_001457370.1 hypothetical protein (macronuclear) [Paramecium tetraurelia strain d4-2]
METHKKIYKRRNELPLNKFHQLKRSKTNQKEGESCKKLKKQVRDLQRLINKGHLNEEIKQTKQQDLETKQKQLNQKQNEYKQQQKKIDYFARKYKKIKQVDLKKLKRQLEKIQKELETTENREPLLEQESEIQEKINYVKYYPKDQKYISLFGKNLNDHAKEQQELLIDKSKKNFKQKELKKYRMIEQTHKEVNDDFLMDEENDQVVSKQLVDKQGKVIKQQKFNSLQ